MNIIEVVIFVLGLFAGLALIGALFALFGEKIDDYIDYEYGNDKEEEKDGD